MLAIYKRELHSYFTSMTGCAFIAFTTALGSLYFILYNMYSGYAYFAYALVSTVFFMIITIPILTMRSFAEDKRNKTEQLLMTAPISLTKIVLGKYFAILTVFAVPVSIFCTFPLIIDHLGYANFFIDYSTILAYFLFGAVFISVGMYVSALTESQVIAAIGSFAILYIFYMWDSFILFCPVYELIDVLAEFSLMGILNNFAYNKIFDAVGLVTYISVAFIFVFLTIQTLQKRRWS
ncbi:MAG: ABC transporter permease [Lachnospiraceae bacterium]